MTLHSDAEGIFALEMERPPRHRRRFVGEVDAAGGADARLPAEHLARFAHGLEVGILEFGVGTFDFQIRHALLERGHLAGERCFGFGAELGRPGANLHHA